MAEGAIPTDDSQQSCEQKEVIEKSSACDKCLELELQLKETLLELSSVQSIIEIVQKAQNMSMCSEHISNSTSTTYEDVDQEVNNNYKLVNSRHSREPKKLKERVKHFTFPNSKTFVTSNQFSTLANIS
jgi:hypothetical protein